MLGNYNMKINIKKTMRCAKFGNRKKTNVKFNDSAG